MVNKWFAVSRPHQLMWYLYLEKIVEILLFQDKWYYSWVPLSITVSSDNSTDLITPICCHNVLKLKYTERRSHLDLEFHSFFCSSHSSDKTTSFLSRNQSERSWWSRNDSIRMWRASSRWIKRSLHLPPQTEELSCRDPPQWHHSRDHQLMQGNDSKSILFFQLNKLIINIQ